MWHPKLIWLSSIGMEDLEKSLLTLRVFQESGLPVKVILNDGNGNQDAEMIEYQWMTLEEQIQASVLGFIPYLRGEIVLKMSKALNEIFGKTWPNPEGQ